MGHCFGKNVTISTRVVLSGSIKMGLGQATINQALLASGCAKAYSWDALELGSTSH